MGGGHTREELRERELLTAQRDFEAVVALGSPLLENGQAPGT
jgi:hypothetical protein